ncbi:18192_t:CDS:2, partial [Racocetra fulgida]
MDVSIQIRNYIIENNLLTVPQLYENIKNEKLMDFYISHGIKFIIADNQLESARLYLENNSSFKLLYQDQYMLAFVTPLLFLLSNKYLKMNGTQDVKTILMDKDHEHLTAASRIWTEAKIQLYYWHVICPIKKKLTSTGITHNYYDSYNAHSLCSIIDPTWQPDRRSHAMINCTNQEQLLNERDKVYCKKNFYKKILQLIQVHFLWHPMIPIKCLPNLLNINQIWIKSIKEQYTFCYQNDLKHVWAYLWSEWYHPEAWKLWARASSSQLNILRTMMTIKTIVYNDDPQVDNQEISIEIINSNENQNVSIVNLDENQDIDIDVNNQDIILYQT